MPVLNEVGYLESAVASILEPGLRRARSRWSSRSDRRPTAPTRCRRSVSSRPTRASGWSRTPAWTSRSGSTSRSRRARYPVIVRVDAHTELAPDYTRPRRRDPRAHRRRERRRHHGRRRASPASRRRSPAPTTAASASGGGAYHGETRAGRPRRVGVHGRHARRGARARSAASTRPLRRGEDWEAQLPPPHRRAHRVARPAAAGQLLAAQQLERKLTRQFFATGVWRGELVRRLGARNPLRFFAPPRARDRRGRCRSC